ncbi:MULTISPECIES: CPBP family intramembrane glutamic endopeptidase [unclassified Psychrobacter]|uniref:CPBP family intramembrane glutamic endopeptidase n=1 Tax=unclassified Psychrobacter TaxID=196806 RepID=UPI000946D2A7|nr:MULTISPECIES: CPBP family intramembrane glutamic endopeptidase [unclassified Psychrobacter]OLF39310.1 abortive phage infection protein [Psychrobacter sp. Cmf 22.2]
MSNRATTVNNTVTPQPKRPALFSRLGAFSLVIGMVIAFFISQLIGVYIAGRLWLPATKSTTIGDIFFFGSNDGTVVSASIIISCLILMALSYLIVRVKSGDIREYLAIKPFSFTIGIGMFGILLVFMIGSQTLTYWLDKSPLAFVDPLYQSVSSVWLLVFAMVIVAPIYEELVFRGILWSAVAEQFAPAKLNGALLASIVTSFIFAVIHLQYGIYEITTIIVLAFIFCYARIKSGSLVLPMLLHIINNGVAMWQYLTQVG